MTDSQLLLDKACALREELKFGEAYGLFVLAANQTDNPLKKAGILLNAATTLTHSDKQQRSRNQLNQIRELLGSMNSSAFSLDEQDEFIGVNVGVEIEEAEILATEGKIEAAIEQLGATLERFKDEIKGPRRTEIYDDIQTRRAYFLTDVDQFEKAIPILEEAQKPSERRYDFAFLSRPLLSQGKTMGRSSAETRTGSSPQAATTHCVSSAWVAWNGSLRNRGLSEGKRRTRGQREISSSGLHQTSTYLEVARIHVYKPRAERESSAVRSTSPTFLREGPD